MRIKRILLTNDDGLEKGNVKQLAGVLINHGYEVSAVIPREDRSGVGGSHYQKKLYKWDIIQQEPYELYIVEGEPVDCIEFARSIFDDFDLVIAGVNGSYNLGLSINSSGTVQAAIRAYGVGLAKRAISINSNSKGSDVIEFIPDLIENLIAQSFYLGNVLNINIPANHRSEFKQTELEHDLTKIYKYPLMIDNENKTFSYPIELNDSSVSENENSDLAAVRNNLISITKLYEEK